MGTLRNATFWIGFPFLLNIILASLLAAFLFYPLISRGMEIKPDSVQYLTTASNFIKGYGFSLQCPPHVTPNSHWGPGYSALIGAFLIFDIDWLLSCKIIAVACYILLLTGISFYVYKITGSLFLGFLSEAATGFHPEILRYSGTIMSEPLSWLFLVAISAALTALLIHPRKGCALALGFILGLSMLVRYAFIPFSVVCVALFLIFGLGISWSQRFRITALICLPATILFGSWLIRNLFLTGEMARPGSPSRSLFVNLSDAFTSWSDVLFSAHERSLQPFLWIVIALLSVFALRAFFSHIDWQKSRPDVGLMVNLFLAIGYTLGLVFLRSYRSNLALSVRMFTPIIVLTVLMLASGAAARYNKYLSRMCLGLFILFSMSSVGFGISATPDLKKRWLGYYEFKSSATLKYAISRGYRPGRIYTNDSLVFLLWARTCTRSFPQPAPGTKASYFQGRGDRILVWFKRTGRHKASVAPEDLEWDISAHLKEFDDGYVYHLKDARTLETHDFYEKNKITEYSEEPEGD